eukprot:6301835-Pyramimonas_sp.AAC.1
MPRPWRGCADEEQQIADSPLRGREVPRAGDRRGGGARTPGVMTAGAEAVAVGGERNRVKGEIRLCREHPL